jgi:hypothetical protein
VQRGCPFSFAVSSSVSVARFHHGNKCPLMLSNFERVGTCVSSAYQSVAVMFKMQTAFLIIIFV